MNSPSWRRPLTVVISTGTAGKATWGRLPAGPEEAMSNPASVELDHAADPILGLHQIKAAVDFVQRDLVGDERLDVDLARQRLVDEHRHLVAPLDAAERGPGEAPAGDQGPRD